VKGIVPWLAVLTIPPACSGVPTMPTPPARTGPTQVAVLAEVLSIRILPEVDTIRLGQTVSFSVAVELGEGGVPPSGGLPRWSSTNPSVISVEGFGNARAIALGEATIEVGAKGRTASRHLRVQP